MSMDYAVSLNGIQSAGWDLERAARRIANSGSSTQATADSESSSDLAADLVEVKRAEVTEKANLRMISMQDELERDTLDTFA